MSDHIEIPANEHGVVRVFALSMPPERALFLREPGATAQVLGLEASDLDTSNVEIFPLSDLDELGLARYLAEGMGVPAEQIDAQRDRLRALTGWVMIIRSSAFRDRRADLTLPPDIMPVASFKETATDWHSPGPTATPSAHIDTDPPRQAPRATPSQKRSIGVYVLIGFIATLLAAVLLLTLL